MNQLKTGDIIGSKRKELGFTQNQLAKMLNISFQAVSKWDAGRVRMLFSLPNAVITYPPSIFQSRGLRKPGTWPGITK